MADENDPNRPEDDPPAPPSGEPTPPSAAGEDAPSPADLPRAQEPDQQNDAPAPNIRDLIPPPSPMRQPITTRTPKPPKRKRKPNQRPSSQ